MLYEKGNYCIVTEDNDIIASDFYDLLKVRCYNLLVVFVKR